MASRVPPYTALRAFDAVGRTGGIRRAADAMGVSHAIVSRHLRALEEQVNVTLFDRGAGRLTQAGGIYHARVSKAFTELAAATTALQARRSGRLIIGCAPGLALHWLTARLQQFGDRDGPAEVELRSLDAAPDLAENLVDADIRYLHDHPRSAVAREIRTLELARPPVIPVAAPDLVWRLRPLPCRAVDLLGMPLIEESSDAEWRCWLSAQDVAAPLGPRVARYGHAHLALAAARAGQGIALGNHYLIADDLATGRLIPVRPEAGDFRPTVLGRYVFLAHRSRWSDPALARFRRWLVAEFERDRPA